MHPELQPALLLSAYANGIFPMADEDGEIYWFSPEPRAVIELDDFYVARSLRQVYQRKVFQVTVNRCFDEVIRCCGERREGTWISNDLIEAYTQLHRLGFAHSVEAWDRGMLAGGLYGVALGGAFFGESMFHRRTNASKVALVYLVQTMRQRGFILLDVQFITEHLRRFGAVEISRDDYLQRLEAAIALPCRLDDRTDADNDIGW